MTTIAEVAKAASTTYGQIRTWCLNGQLAATKQAGHWEIDPASLTSRLERVERLTAFLVAAGGSEWHKATMHRVYFSSFGPQGQTANALEWAGLTFGRHPEGRPHTAFLDGRWITDVGGGLRDAYTAVDAVYVNILEEALHITHQHWASVMTYVDGATGEQGTIDLLARITTAFTEHTGLTLGPLGTRVRGSAAALYTPDSWS